MPGCSLECPEANRLAMALLHVTMLAQQMWLHWGGSTPLPPQQGRPRLAPPAALQAATPERASPTPGAPAAPPRLAPAPARWAGYGQSWVMFRVTDRVRVKARVRARFIMSVRVEVRSQRRRIVKFSLAGSSGNELVKRKQQRHLHAARGRRPHVPSYPSHNLLEHGAQWSLLTHDVSHTQGRVRH